MAEALLEALAWLGLAASLGLLAWRLLPARRRGQWPAALEAARRRWRGRWRERRRAAEARREADAAIRRAQRHARRDPRPTRPDQPKDSREPH